MLKRVRAVRPGCADLADPPGPAVGRGLGRSFQYGDQVSDLLAARFPTTLALVVYSTVLFVVLGVGAGILAAVRRGTWVDSAVVGGTALAASVPSFVGGIALVAVLRCRAGLVPGDGERRGFRRNAAPSDAARRGHGVRGARRDQPGHTAGHGGCGGRRARGRGPGGAARTGDRPPARPAQRVRADRHHVRSGHGGHARRNRRQGAGRDRPGAPCCPLSCRAWPSPPSSWPSTSSASGPPTDSAPGGSPHAAGRQPVESYVRQGAVRHGRRHVRALRLSAAVCG